jgi:hypothetical protein
MAKSKASPVTEAQETIAPALIVTPEEKTVRHLANMQAIRDGVTDADPHPSPGENMGAPSPGEGPLHRT